MDILKELSIGKISALHPDSGFPVETQLQKNGQIFRPLAKTRYRCHFFLGPVRQNLTRLNTWKMDMCIICQLDAQNQVLWWSKLSPPFLKFLRLIKCPRPSQKRIGTLLRENTDELYLLYQMLQGNYGFVSEQLQPVMYRPVHPYRRINQYKRYRGWSCGRRPLYFAFLCTALTRRFSEYTTMYTQLPPEHQQQQLRPSALREFVEFISGATCEEYTQSKTPRT